MPEKMTISEAREIVKHPENYCDNPMLHQRYDNAKGFIYGHSSRYKELKGLVGALEKIRSKNGLQYSDIFEICDKALSKFREAGK